MAKTKALSPNVQELAKLAEKALTDFYALKRRYKDEHTAALATVHDTRQAFYNASEGMYLKLPNLPDNYQER